MDSETLLEGKQCFFVISAEELCPSHPFECQRHIGAVTQRAPNIQGFVHQHSRLRGIAFPGKHIARAPKSSRPDRIRTAFGGRECSVEMVISFTDMRPGQPEPPEGTRKRQ